MIRTKNFELTGDLLERTTNKNYNIDLHSLLYKKFMFEFAKELNFDEKSSEKTVLEINHLLKYFNELLLCFLLQLFHRVQDFCLPVTTKFVID